MVYIGGFTVPGYVGFQTSLTSIAKRPAKKRAAEKAAAAEAAAATEGNSESERVVGGDGVVMGDGTDLIAMLDSLAQEQKVC